MCFLDLPEPRTIEYMEHIGNRSWFSQRSYSIDSRMAVDCSNCNGESAEGNLRSGRMLAAWRLQGSSGSFHGNWGVVPNSFVRNSSLKPAKYTSAKLP